MKIIEYQEKYIEDIKDLMVELEEYLSSIDKDELDRIHPDYRDKATYLSLEKYNVCNGKCYLAIDNNKAIGLIIGTIPEYDEYGEKNSSCEIIVAKENNKIIGSITMYKINLFTFSFQPMIELFNVAVLKEYRGKKSCKTNI